MANTTLSTYMNLPVPVVGVDPGPQWAADINSCLTLVDQHNHSSGSGVQITPAGLSINTDLPFQINNAINLRSVRFTSQGAVLSGVSDLGCLYEVGNDLYYNDGTGTQIRITQSGGIAGTPGAISNLTSPATASYVSANSTFVWQSAANTPANLDAASVIFRNLSANSKGLTLNPPASMAANYTLTLPPTPASQKFMTLDSSGNMTAPWACDNSTVEITGGTTLQVKNLGITTAKLAGSSVTYAKIANPTFAISSDINYSSNSDTTALVQIASVNITLSGNNRPVIVGLTSGAQSGFNANSPWYKYGFPGIGWHGPQFYVGSGGCGVVLSDTTNVDANNATSGTILFGQAFPNLGGINSIDIPFQSIFAIKQFGSDTSKTFYFYLWSKGATSLQQLALYALEM